MSKNDEPDTGGLAEPDVMEMGGDDMAEAAGGIVGMDPTDK